jgi:hypothetical protein
MSDTILTTGSNTYYETMNNFLERKGIYEEDRNNYIEFLKDNNGEILSDTLEISKDSELGKALAGCDVYQIGLKSDATLTEYLNFTSNALSELEEDRNGDEVSDGEISSESKALLAQQFLLLGEGATGLSPIYLLPGVIIASPSINEYTNNFFDFIINKQKYNKSAELASNFPQVGNDSDLYDSLCNLMDGSLEIGPDISQLKRIYDLLGPEDNIRDLDWYAEWRFQYELYDHLKTEYNIEDPVAIFTNLNEFNKAIANNSVIFYTPEIYQPSDDMELVDYILRYAFGYDKENATFDAFKDGGVLDDTFLEDWFNEIFDKKKTRKVEHEDGFVNKKIEDIHQRFGRAQTISSPLVLDVDGNDFETKAKTDGVYFDLDNNGFAEKTAWTSGDAFLTYDLNENGKIDNGGELFGNHTLVGENKAADGFAALAQYDENLDGFIDENDDIYHLMRLWNDNGDGVSEDGEFKTLEEMGVAFTYNEPILSYEYILDTSPLIHKDKQKVVLVSNGNINREPLKKLLSRIDAFSITL